MITLMPTLLGAQILFGNGTPDASAALDVQSNGGGTLFPRLTQTQRDGIASPATGLMLYNTTSKCLEVNVGTPTTAEWSRLNCLPGSIATLNCAGAAVSGSLELNQAASGVSVSVPCTGGNGGAHDGQTVASTGVTGLTATLSPGGFPEGSGSITYAITGTPTSGGTVSFALNIGGQTCTLDVNVNVFVCTTGCCAKVSATEYKNFLCYNLGAANTTTADPFNPTWEINGGYWQWGRSAEAAAGPTATDPNSGTVNGWIMTVAANGSWADGNKTGNDPCPPGFRVPTIAQWEGVIANNTITNVGSFDDSATNYGAGKKFGDQLMLPAAGGRSRVNGTLFFRAFVGYYWSSTEFNNNLAYYLSFNSSNVSSGNSNRAGGHSVRCVAQ
jgi:uncharacterized protein (TIGR02145 family)